MFNKENIEKAIKELGLENKKYIVYMGGSLCVRGIRDTNDIDLGVEEKDFQRLKKRFNKLYTISVMGYGKFEINTENGTIEIFKAEDFYDKIEKNDGVWCQKLDEIIKMKKYFGREKDFKDIELINNMM